MSAAPARLGVFLVGARGAVATTTVVGAAAIAAGLAPTTGLVTELAPVREGTDLVALSALVFGGLDVVERPLIEQARRLAAQGVLPSGLLEAVEPSLFEADRRIGVGVLGPSAPSVRAEACEAALRTADWSDRERIDSIRDALERFAAQAGLERVVVVHLGSVEPVAAEPDALATEDELRAAIEDPSCALPASVLYAIAAIECGFPFVNFTPAPGARAPVLQQRARERGVPLAGRDGKTGETLLKSVLAPLFAARHLHVRSWAGYNILGNRDGAALADPQARRGKLASKRGVLGAILPPGQPETERVTIEYVPSLGDRKTAWDHVHFRGFLGVDMRFEFTWHGCDSALAAPLVLDLVRLIERCERAGLAGPLPQLACFFKDPVGPAPADFASQHAALLALCARWRARSRR